MSKQDNGDSVFINKISTFSFFKFHLYKRGKRYIFTTELWNLTKLSSKKKVTEDSSLLSEGSLPLVDKRSSRSYFLGGHKRDQYDPLRTSKIREWKGYRKGRGRWGRGKTGKSAEDAEARAPTQLLSGWVRQGSGHQFEDWCHPPKEAFCLHSLPCPKLISPKCISDFCQDAT